MGLFDDLIPTQPRASASGLFDDLIPEQPPSVKPPARPATRDAAQEARPSQATPEMLRRTGAWADPTERPMGEMAIAALMLDPAPAQGSAVADPFADEAFNDLAGRRGQQAAAGVTESVAALPEQMAR